MIPLTDSRTTVLTHPRIIIFGAPECGKTVMACSVSDLFPKEILLGQKPKKHTHLKDTLFVLFDNGGLDSLAEWNISAPVLPYKIGDKLVAPDHSGLAGGAILPAIQQICKDVQEVVTKQGIKHVVFDTFSTLDAGISAYMQSKFADEKDNRRVWGQVLGVHLDLINGMKPVRATVIYNCHLKDELEAQSDKEQAGKQATRAASGFKSDGTLLKPEITGRAFRIYNAACSLVLPLAADKVKKGDKTETVRKVYPLGYKNLISKCRFQTLLDQVEPPDLGYMLNKIRSKVADMGGEDAMDDDLPPSVVAAALKDLDAAK